jgi:2-polyprenyl-6-methoxyphenol hydroxylase-like FAD-dependent oxidoreductase
MSPFGGEGVNAALLDAARLAEALSEHSHWDTSQVAAFETDMFERVREAAIESADAAATALSHDSLAITLAMHREREAAKFAQPVIH